MKRIKWKIKRPWIVHLNNVHWGFVPARSEFNEGKKLLITYRVFIRTAAAEVMGCIRVINLCLINPLPVYFSKLFNILLSLVFWKKYVRSALYSARRVCGGGVEGAPMKVVIAIKWLFYGSDATTEIGFWPIASNVSLSLILNNISLSFSLLFSLHSISIFLTLSLSLSKYFHLKYL